MVGQRIGAADVSLLLTFDCSTHDASRRAAHSLDSAFACSFWVYCRSLSVPCSLQPVGVRGVWRVRLPAHLELSSQAPKPLR